MDLQELAEQLRKPQGETGLQVAEMMNKGNLLLNQWAIAAMQLKEGDSVLEIGMGNGYFVKDILSVHPTITYTGLDYSDLMTEEASTLNKIFVKNNRAAFYTGNASALPFAGNTFSAIMCVNTIYFWEDGKSEMAELKRVLKKGGRIVIGIRSKKSMEKMPFTQYGFRKFDKENLILWAKQNGLVVKNLEEKIEPPYEFNGESIELENFILTAVKY